MQLSAYSPLAMPQYSNNAPIDAPESTANAQPTTTALPSGSSSTSSPKKSHAGAIAGGVVGGVIFLCLVCIAAFWFIRRRRKGVAPSNLVPTPMGYHSTGHITPFTAPETPKLYVSGTRLISTPLITAYFRTPLIPALSRPLHHSACTTRPEYTALRTPEIP